MSLHFSMLFPMMNKKQQISGITKKHKEKHQKIWIYMWSEFAAVAAAMFNSQTKFHIKKTVQIGMEQELKKKTRAKHTHRIYKQRDVSLQDSTA